jgi:hypothetical protein
MPCAAGLYPCFLFGVSKRNSQIGAAKKKAALGTLKLNVQRDFIRAFHSPTNALFINLH